MSKILFPDKIIDTTNIVQQNENTALGTISTNDVTLTTGHKLHIKDDGSAPACGVAVLSSGSVTVSTTAVSSFSNVIVTRQTDSSNGSYGYLKVVNKVNASGFDVISCDNAGSQTNEDGTNIFWLIIDSK